MAQNGENQTPAIQQTSSVQSKRFPIFENYLKMARINLTEEDVLDRCLVPDDGPNVSVTAAHNGENNVANLDNLMELDQESLLNMLEGDSDFSDTVSDFSSISISHLKRKKKRSERWRRGKSASTQRSVSPSSESIDNGLRRHKISPHGAINHKTIIMEHDDTRGTSKSEEEVEKPKSRHSSRSSKSSTPRIAEEILNLDKNEDVELNNSRSQSRNSHKTWSSAIERATSSSASEDSSTDMLTSSPAGVTPNQYKKARHGRHRKRTKGSRVNSDAETPTEHRKRERRCRNVVKSDRSDCTVSTSECDERNLGRNMRATARTGPRKLRT